MEYFLLKGFLLVLILQHCTSEGPTTSAQSSMAVAHHDGQALPQESELPPAESAPVVSPPSLEEVHQAVQEASEQVEEGRGAEEVLKELLERVVEAAMGQVEGGNEGKSDEGAAQDMVEEDEQGETEADIETKVEEQAAVETAEGGEVGNEEQEAVEGDAVEEAEEEGEGVAGEEGEAAAGFVEETTGAEAGGGADGAEVIDESLDTEVSDGAAETAVEDAGAGDDDKQVALSEETDAAEADAQNAEESLSVADVAVDEETVESDRNQAVTDVERLDALGGEELPGGEAEAESDESALPSDNHELDVEGELLREEEEEEEEKEVAVVVEQDTVEPVVQDYEGHLAVWGGAAGGVVTEGADVGEAAGGDGDGEGEAKEESVASVEEGDDQHAGGEEQTAETSQGSETEGPETLVISAPEPEHGAEASIEQNAENQTPTLNSSTGGVETGENTLGEEKSNHGNEIITPTDELLPHSPEVAQPTLDNAVNDVQAELPQAELEELGQTNELVEDSMGTTEVNELGLEAWKIGAIAAAVFLVLETMVIVIYILKCRNKNKNPATQRACEEGCVEAEAATGGDCSDDTLPAGDGDAQQIAALDQCEVASTPARNKEQHSEEQAIAMSDVPGEESASAGPGPDSSPDIRTSIL